MFRSKHFFIASVILLALLVLCPIAIENKCLYSSSLEVVNHGTVARIPSLNEHEDGEENEDGGKHTIDESFAQYWPHIKEGTCPNMVPNPRVWKTIVKLARAELNFADPSHNDTDDPLYRDFFEFSDGGCGFMDEDGENSTIYLKIWKGGNNQIRWNMEWRIKENYGRKFFDHWSQMGLYRDMNNASTIPNRSTQNQFNEKKTCIITAVRDPISHFISAYNEVEFRDQFLPNENRLPKTGEKPLLFTRFELGSTQRFRQFVADFVGGPRHYGWYKDATELTHLYSMTGVLHELNLANRCLGSNFTLAAYLPNLSNLDSTFPKFMSETCPGVPAWFEKPFNYEIRHDSQDSEYDFKEAGKEIWAEHGDIAKALCALHVLDYACFDSIPVPDICKRVYGDEDFANTLLAAASDPSNDVPIKDCALDLTLRMTLQ